MDTCGVTRTVLCGSCALPQVCGAGGTANVCGTCGQNCWKTLAPIPAPALAREAMATSGGKVYVFEGAASDGGTSNATLSYDPGINEWATLTPSPQSRSFAKAAELNGKIYVIGGCTSGDCQAGFTGANVQYDPASDTWTSRAAMPTARSGFAMAASATRIYVAGGAQACPPCTPVNTLEIYDPTADSWTTGAAMAAARGDTAAAVVGSSLVVVSGTDSSGAPALLNEAYDPVGNAWSTPTAMGSPHVGGGASALNGQLLATGGSDSALNELYDPVGNTWRAVAPAPVARSSAVAATVGGIVFLAGAEAGNVPSRRFDAYWSAPPPAPTAQTIMSGLGRGLSISGGYLFFGGLTNSAANPQAVLGRFTLPVDAGVMPDWTQRWPSVASQEAFNGVVATNEGVYGCGYSYSFTIDTGGSKEYKGVTAKFPIDGGAAEWVAQTPGPPGAFAYSGYELLQGCTMTSEAQQLYLYAGGYSQNSFQNNGRAYYSKVNAADGGIVFTFTDTVVNPVSVDFAFAPANGFIYVAGRKDDTGTMTPMLYEVDTFGDPPVWTHAAAYAGQFLGVTTHGSSVYAAGHRYQTGMTGPSDGLLEKLDASGTLIWSKVYNRGTADTVLRGVVVIGANVYGVGYSGVAGNTSAIIVQVDEATGDLLTTTLHGSMGEMAYAAATDGTDLYVLADINAGGPMTLLRYTVP
jgi:hypothetical protein